MSNCIRNFQPKHVSDRGTPARHRLDGKTKCAQATRIIFAFLILAAGFCHDAKADGETNRATRTLVIRYDGDQITLTEQLLVNLVTTEEARKAIDDSELQTKIYADTTAKQPTGVFMGFAQLSSEDGIEDVDAKFEVVQRILSKALNKRLDIQKHDSLMSKSTLLKSLIRERESEAASIQKEMEKNVSKGSPEDLQKIMIKMIERGTEKSIQRDLSVAMTEQLKEVIKKLDKKRAELERHRNLLQLQMKDGVELLEIRVAEDELKMQEIGIKAKAAEKEFSPQHPEVHKLRELHKANSKQLNVRKKMLEERLDTSLLLSEVETELNRCRNQATKASQQYQELLIQQRVADYEKDLVEEHSEQLRSHWFSASRVVPALEAKSQMLQEELRMLRAEKLSIDAKIRNLQRVVVEFW